MLYQWIIASRPWTFTAAFTPIALGTSLAISDGYHFDLFLFILALLGGIFLQAGANFLNTYGDYMSGVDTIDSAITCPQIVTGILPAYKMKYVGIGMLTIAIIIGLFLTFLCGWPVFAFGFIGFLGAASYTTGWFPYKYKGLGPIFVFFLMGPFMVLPAYYIQTYLLNINIFFVSIPIAFLVTAIMHANDLRDIEYDNTSGIKTIALWLGFKYSLLLYKVICIMAFVVLVCLVALRILPTVALLPLVLFPLLIRKFKRIKYPNITVEIKNLVKWTAGFHFLFGLFFIIGILLSPFVHIE